MAPQGCPFCSVENAFQTAFFSKENRSYRSERWIDYEETSLAWYAVLNGDQYTRGHSLVIQGRLRGMNGTCHRETILDPLLTTEELNCFISGIRRVAKRLRDNLNGVKAVHVLSLCEGVRHLHCHLLPRYDYTDEQERFYENLYRPRTVALGHDFEEFDRRIADGDIHGMWYACYGEATFPETDFYKHAPEDRARMLQSLAERLRNPDLTTPF